MAIVMTNSQIDREVHALALAVYDCREARRTGNYRKAIESIEEARAHANAVLGHLAEIEHEIGTRDLADELRSSLESVDGKGAA